MLNPWDGFEEVLFGKAFAEQLRRNQEKRAEGGDSSTCGGRTMANNRKTSMEKVEVERREFVSGNEAGTKEDSVQSTSHPANPPGLSSHAAPIAQELNARGSDELAPTRPRKYLGEADTERWPSRTENRHWEKAKPINWSLRSRVDPFAGGSSPSKAHGAALEM